MKRVFFLLFMLSMCSIMSFSNNDEKSTIVLIETSMGSLKVKLYNETPLHRDNFIKLIKENFYDGVLFHRVIKEFMIQAGDPNSKNCSHETRLGAGDIGYKLPAEILFPKYYHKRGALAAARQADFVNPERQSSACQFYIVEGRKFSDEELNVIENRIGHNIGDVNFHYSDEQRIMYKTFGGTPHLDGQYTVFGEVVEGYDLITKISNVSTNNADRPVEDIKILRVKIVKK